MTPNEDALQCADYLDEMATASDIGRPPVKSDTRRKSSAHLKRLVAENEAQAALLRQAHIALINADDFLDSQIMPNTARNVSEAIAAITQHLENKQ